MGASTVTSDENAKSNGPRSRKGMRTRARLVDAAKEIFEESGFVDARISDIAERAGLTSHGSFYHYFASKEDVFREVAAAVDERLSSPLGSVILAPSSGTPFERVREAIRQHLESYRREARIIGVIEQVSRYDDQFNAERLKRHRRYRAQVAGAIRQLQRHHLADPTLDPALAAAILGSMTNRFPEMWLVQGFVRCSFDDAVEQLTRVFTNGLGLKDEQEAPGPSH